MKSCPPPPPPPDWPPETFWLHFTAWFDFEGEPTPISWSVEMLRQDGGTEWIGAGGPPDNAEAWWTIDEGPSTALLEIYGWHDNFGDYNARKWDIPVTWNVPTAYDITTWDEVTEGIEDPRATFTF